MRNLEKSFFLRLKRNIGLDFTKATGEIKQGATVLGKYDNGILTVEKSGLELVENPALLGTIEEFSEISKVVDGGVEYTTDGLRIDNGLRMAGNGTYCFTANTLMIDGRKIADIKTHDQLKTVDANGNAFTATVNKVKQSLTRRLTELMVAGQLLVVTPNHPLQTSNGNWLAAEDIQQGTLLKGANGPTQVESVCTEAVQPTTVYSLELENNLPYFVGQAPVLAAGKCLLLTLKSKLGVDFNKFQNMLISFKITSTERKAIYEALENLSSVELNTWMSNFNDPKVFTELNRIADSPSYKGIFVELAEDKAKMQAFKEVINEPVLSYEKLKEGYLGVTLEWIDKRMWEYVGLGKKFDDVAFNSLKSGTWRAKLADIVKRDFGVDNLDDYQLFSQVQFRYNTTDYFVADQVFVKYRTIMVNGLPILEIDDLIIIENKLNIGTALTSNQRTAKAINSYWVRGNNSIKDITSGSQAAFSGQIKWVKVYDGSNGNAITDITTNF